MTPVGGQAPSRSRSKTVVASPRSRREPDEPSERDAHGQADRAGVLGREHWTRWVDVRRMLSSVGIARASPVAATMAHATAAQLNERGEIMAQTRRRASCEGTAAATGQQPRGRGWARRWRMTSGGRGPFVVALAALVGPPITLLAASTLLDVLTTQDAAEKHGPTLHLGDVERAQLVAYLQQLDDAEPEAPRMTVGATSPPAIETRATEIEGGCSLSAAPREARSAWGAVALLSAWRARRRTPANLNHARSASNPRTGARCVVPR